MQPVPHPSFPPQHFVSLFIAILLENPGFRAGTTPPLLSCCWYDLLRPVQVQVYMNGVSSIESTAGADRIPPPPPRNIFMISGFVNPRHIIGDISSLMHRV